MKTCTKCNIEKPRNEFTQHTWCKPCMSDWNFNRGLEIKRFIYQYKKTTPCVECGAVGNPFNIEFDHVRGNKEFNIAHAFLRKDITIEKLKVEIAKCDI
mgnify:CR=1 FL=1